MDWKDRIYDAFYRAVDYLYAQLQKGALDREILDAVARGEDYKHSEESDRRFAELAALGRIKVTNRWDKGDPDYGLRGMRSLEKYFVQKPKIRKGYGLIHIRTESAKKSISDRA